MWRQRHSDRHPEANHFTCTFPDGPATTTINVTANNGPVLGDDPHIIRIDNVAPTAILVGDASVDEGATYSLSLGETDPGRDTVTAFVVDWGDGSSNTYASGGAKTHVYADGTFTRTISVDLVDEDDTYLASATKTILVNNVAPTVMLEAGNTYTWDESKTAQRTFAYSATDPAGSHDPLEMTIDCGTAGAFVAGSDTGSTFACLFANGQANPTISVSADDGDGGTGSASHAVTIANVAPVVTLTGDASVNEGQVKTYSFTTSDPGADTFVVVGEGCGDAATISDETFDSATGVGSFNCTFPDGPANSTVGVQVKDSDEAQSNTDTIDVSIANVAPAVTITGDASVNEGQTKTYGFSTSDPGADTFAVVSKGCGDNGNISDYTFDSATGAGSFNCTFPDGPANSSVSVQVKDSDEAQSNTDTIAVSIANIAPAFGTFPANAGGQYSDPIDADTTATGIQALTLSATDAGVDTISFSIDKDACVGGQGLPGDLNLTDNGDGTAKLTGRFDVIPTTYTPCIVATDSDDATTARKLTITVAPEDAMIVDIEPTFVEIDGVDGDKDVVPLTAKFVEASDGNPSSTLDTYATAYGATDVKLVLDPVGTNGSSRNCTDTGVPTPGGGVGCSVVDLLSDVYEIDATVQSAWFVGDGIGTIAVFDPANGFSTGGGHFLWANGPGPWTDAKVNFGFTGKKLNKNVKGSVLTVIHTDAGPYVIKTNAFTGMANAQVKGTDYWYTSMTGKATYAVPEGQVNPWCSPGVLKCGSFTIIMYAEDRVALGAGVDTYKLKLIAPDKKVVFDMTLQTIAGGNVQVAH